MDDAFGNWLAGFIDGEGCFTVEITNKRRPCVRFNILVRNDDAAVITEIHRRTGIGKLIFRPARYYKNRVKHALPQIVWRVQRRDECMALVDVLDRYPLRAKKARDYAIWREAVLDMVANPLAYGKKPHGRGDDDAYLARMEKYRAALKAAREYSGEVI